ncbi:polymer-forming cytoskeletal protein [bacterium]|jgi:cytoskeletal protein CcmA (bactofilin family)|nr:polymer-forming cytoskeletal protein [bacterium]
MTTSGKPPKFDSNIVTTIVGEETEFKGTLHAQGSVRVEGTLEGEIYSQGEVTIGEKSCVKANIFAKRIIVAGEVTGNIEAIQGLKICKTGKVFGDITGDRLIVEEGGIYKGKVNMDVISSKNLYEGNFELAKAK